MAIILFALIIILDYLFLKGVFKYVVGLTATSADIGISNPDYDDLSEDSLCTLYYTSYKYPA